MNFRKIVAPFLVAASLTAAPAQAQSARDILRAGIGNGVEDQIIKGAGDVLGGLFKKKPKVDVADLAAVPPLSEKDQTKYQRFIAMPAPEYAALASKCDATPKDKACKDFKGFRDWQNLRKTIGFDVVPSIIEGQLSYAPAGTTNSVFNWTVVAGRKGSRSLPFLPTARTLTIIGEDGNKKNVDIASLQSMAASGALSGFKVERTTDATGSKIGDGGILRLIAYQNATNGSVLYVDKQDLLSVIQRGPLNAWITTTDPKIPQAQQQQAPKPAGPTIPVR